MAFMAKVSGKIDNQVKLKKRGLTRGMYLQIVYLADHAEKTGVNRLPERRTK